MKKLISIALSILLAACGSNSTDTGRSIPVVNGDFEQTANGNVVPGWAMLQHAGAPSYEMLIDADGAFQGHGSFRITRTHEQVYGSIQQNIVVDQFAEKTVELSAMLKSKDVGPKGWKLFLAAPGQVMYSVPLTGSADWTRETVSFKLPKGTRTITVGASLLDGGTGWLDNVELHVVDR